uniref:Uncharacterized protein n=1 Tax=Oryza brachyantha TaxID=4533 RepID=J3MSG6_ORYBR
MASLLAQELRDGLAGMNSSTERADGESAPPPIVIDRVADMTRNVDKQEYVPHHVSIGPYSRRVHPALARDADKMVRLQEVISAAADYSAAPLRLEDCVVELARMEHSVRSCYKHRFDVPGKEFLRWLLLDACYILVGFGDVVVKRRRPDGEEHTAEAVNGVLPGRSHVGGRHKRLFLHRLLHILRQLGGIVRRRPDEPTAPSVEMKASAVHRRETVEVVRDVFYLAENQIPFIVVDRIYQMAFPDSRTPALDAFARCAHGLLGKYSIATPTKVEEPERSPEPANLLHLLHMHFRPTVLARPTGSQGGGGGMAVGRWRTALDYYFAGVTFKKRPLNHGGEGAAVSILDVKVSGSGGTLEVPQLSIDAETWRLFRNLMALEQSNPVAAGSHVTAYCVFMSQLASTDTDVELLSRRGVIVHGLGNHSEVAGHFANLCKGAVFEPDDAEQNYLRPVCQKLEKRFRSRLRRWMAWLRKKYFANPWLAVGLVAAVVGLVCTVVQAVYSVLSYKK